MQTQIQGSNFILPIVVITLVFFVVALFMFLYINLFIKRKKRFIEDKKNMQQIFQQQLLQSQIETQEETMSILGKELHDNVGQLLSSTKMLIGVAERNLTTPPESLLIAGETLSKAIHELRSLSKSLNKDWLEQFDLIENLHTEIARINAAKLIEVQFEHPAHLPLPANEQLILFRIVQEALQNALKHAAAKQIWITLLIEGTSMQLTVEDDGKGFSVEHVTQGTGLINIKQRVKLLGGTVDWQNKNHGTVMQVYLPIQVNTK